MEGFAQVLTGGHPNSLGRTVEVVDAVLADRSRLLELLGCYASDDPVVRLRTSSALKRVAQERQDWVVPLLDRLIGEVGALDQPSAQWTLAQLFLRLAPDMSPDQRRRATDLLKRNLEQSQDWIVLITTAETLSRWSGEDPALRRWLEPQLHRLAADRRRSVASRASRLLARAATPPPRRSGTLRR